MGSGEEERGRKTGKSEDRKERKKKATNPLVFRVFDRILLKHFICVGLQVVH